MSLSTAFYLYIGITVLIWIAIYFAIRIKPENAAFIIYRVVPAVIIIDGIVGSIFLWLRMAAYL